MLPRTINTVSDIYILGIESSCDETAAAVVRSGEEVVSSVVYSQIATHQAYGGVVPELASREHLRAVVPVVTQGTGGRGQKLRHDRRASCNSGTRTRWIAACRSQLCQSAGVFGCQAAHRRQSSRRTHPRRAAGRAAARQSRTGIPCARAGGQRRSYPSLSGRAPRATDGCTTMWDRPATTRRAKPSTKSLSCWNSAIPAAL